MKRAIVPAALVMLAATAAAGAATKAAAVCRPGTQKVGSVVYRVYCGPASATVKVGGETHAFHNGSCVRVGITKVFTMSIGKLTISKGKPRYNYFGVTVVGANGDGTYRRAVVTWAFGGERQALSSVNLRLTHKQTRGSFSGRATGSHDTVTGSFRCK
jgi:hypothetical protein